MINFDQIKISLVEKGIALPLLAESATQKHILIQGEWNRDETITVIKVSAGWKIGDFVKTLPVKIEVPAINAQNIEQIKADMQSVYGATVTVKIA